MLQYIAKRLLYMIPTLLGIAVITFVFIRMAPGDPARQFQQAGGQVVQKSQQVASENVEEFRRQYGLDQPTHIQFLKWMQKLVTFDFGRSIVYRNRMVSDLLMERLIVTMQISIASVLIIYLLSLPLGVLLAVKEGTTIDKVTTVSLFGLYSLPSFFLALLALQFLANNDYLRWFPTRGFMDPELPADASMWRSMVQADFGMFWTMVVDRAHHLFLPVVVTSITSLTYLAMQMRSNLLEVLRQDYIRTARAKGLPEKIVVFKHAVRNSLIPILTIFSAVLPMLISGSVIIETVFEVDGMGKFAFEAILFRDYNVIMAVTVLSAVLTLLGILISDILYVLVDPRISFD